MKYLIKKKKIYIQLMMWEKVNQFLYKGIKKIKNIKNNLIITMITIVCLTPIPQLIYKTDKMNK
jgi:hypothetical protein